MRKEEEGFSLIELVVVVAVLAALSAVAIPRFNCIQRKAKATTALAAMKQIQTECAVNETSTGTFSTGNLNSYQIQSDGSNSCNGAQNTGLITAIPNNTSQLPTFLLATNSNELTYSFRGQTGTNFSDCLELVCGQNNSDNLPPNVSTLFGPDSGLSCREVKRYILDLHHGGTSMAGKAQVETNNISQALVPPVKLRIGDAIWTARDVETKMKREPWSWTESEAYDPNKSYGREGYYGPIDREWMTDVAEKIVETINKNEFSNIFEENELGEFSAEVDYGDLPNYNADHRDLVRRIYIYAPSGTNNHKGRELTQNDLSTEVYYGVDDPDCLGLICNPGVPDHRTWDGSDPEPFAIPQFHENPLLTLETTTVCDGRQT